MAIMRYEPASVVSQLQNDINRIFGHIIDNESSSATAQWVPAVDVREYVDRFELLVDLPGVKPNAVEITLDNSVLTVSGERREEKLSQGNGSSEPQQQRTERPMGQFYRRFILPDTVDGEKVTAIGNEGVLAISIAKHAKAQPKRITVNSR
jgi:HSP20 family protein